MNDLPQMFENDLIAARHAHLAALQKRKIPVYVSSTKRTHTVAKTLSLWGTHQKDWSSTVGSPSESADVIGIAGRITALRSHGGATFADIEDGTGKLQILAEQSALHDSYELWSLFDLGDFVEVSGQLFMTKRSEITLHADSFQLLTKTLRPLPDKWSGLEDVETRYRQRYADLIANPEVRQRFAMRSRVVKAIRSFLEAEDFMEVETPVLQPMAGGATAKPFITHYNAYDTDVYLRVAPELYHKRLIVGGFERVYEFARVFRNEGVDHAHNPEFTDLEFYCAYWDYEQLMHFTEKLLRHAAMGVHGSHTFHYGAHELDFAPPFPRVRFADAVRDVSDINIFDETEETLRAKLKARNIEAPTHADFGKLCDCLFKAQVRPTLIQPTFVTDHPIELSPLAKQNGDRTVARFQLYVAGEFELCNAFSELNDPREQQKRFEVQKELKARGDEEAQSYDTDYIQALEYGMPPTAGFGMGIDRLVALLADAKTLREVILFPYMRPKDGK